MGTSASVLPLFLVILCTCISRYSPRRRRSALEGITTRPASAREVECHNQEALVDAILNRGDRELLTVSNRMSVSDDPGLWSVLVPFWRTGMEKMRWSMCTDDIYYANPYLKNILVAGKTLPIKRNRGMEQPLFKKKLAERVEKIDETEKVTLTSKLERKRQQDLAMERMSVLPAIMGLPEGIHQRDDAFTKAEAFFDARARP